MAQRKSDVGDGIFRKVKQALNKEGYEPDSQLLVSLIHSLPLNVFAKDLDGRFIFANDFYCKSVGKTHDEIIGKTDYEIHPGELADKYREDDKRIMMSRQTESIEEAWQSIGGEHGYIQVVKSPLLSNINREQVIGTIGVFWDITNRKKTEIELAEERNLLRTLIDILPESIYIKDPDSRFITANKSAAQLMEAGSPENVLGRTDRDFFSESDAENFRCDELQVIQQEKPLLNKEESFCHEDGKDVWLLTNKLPLHNIKGEVVGLVGIGHDITKRKEAERERKRLETQLLHARKMETVGTLAGGIAHDFNNLLMGIQGHTSLIETKIDDRHPFWEHIKAIEECVLSATDLTNQLLGFARSGKYEVKPSSFNELIDKTVEMFSRARKEIRIIKSFEARLWVVEIDRRQMEQVLLNLFINAWQAMPGGGDLYLRSEILCSAKLSQNSIH